MGSDESLETLRLAWQGIAGKEELTFYRNELALGLLLDVSLGLGRVDGFLVFSCSNDISSVHTIGAVALSLQFALGMEMRSLDTSFACVPRLNVVTKLRVAGTGRMTARRVRTMVERRKSILVVE